MNEKVYSVVNVYNCGRGMGECATFTDYSSAAQFARSCVHSWVAAMPEDYNGYLAVIRYSKGQSFYFGDQLLKITPNGEEFEEEGDK